MGCAAKGVIVLVLFALLFVVGVLLFRLTWRGLVHAEAAAGGGTSA